MIKAVVFDFGNVISEPHDTSCYGRMADLTGLTESIFREMFWRYRPDFDRGTIGGIEMYRAILADVGKKGTEAELTELAGRLLDEDVASWFHILPGVTAWGRALKADGLTLGILSNMPRDFLERYRTRIDFFIEADLALFSCECGLVKPESAIYKELISRLKLEPREIVFFDDIEANVEGARKEGINAFLWTGLERAKADLKTLE